MANTDVEWLLVGLKGRASRSQFLKGLMIVGLLAVAGVFAFRLPFGAFCALNPDATSGQIYFTAFGVALVVISVALVCLVAKRLKDMGIPGWLALLTVVPIWVLPALFYPGFGGNCSLNNPANWTILMAAATGYASLFTVLALVGGKKGDTKYGADPRPIKQPDEPAD